MATKMKLGHLQKSLFGALFFVIFTCSASSAQTSNPPSEKQDSLIKDVIQSTATVIGVAGGILGLYRYLSEKREKEVREWQKVVIYRIFQEEGEIEPLAFSRVQEKYLDKAQTLRDFNLSKKEISEDSLQRVLLELSVSGILTLVPKKSFRLKVEVPQLDLVKRNEELNLELTKVIGSHPFVFTIEEVAFKIGEKLKLEPLLCQGSIIAGINAGFLVINNDRKIAFASASKNI
jgi:hypothetical protein